MSIEVPISQKFLEHFTKTQQNNQVEAQPDLDELCGSMVHMALNLLKKMIKDYKVNRVLRNDLESSKPGNLL